VNVSNTGGSNGAIWSNPTIWTTSAVITASPKPKPLNKTPVGPALANPILVGSSTVHETKRLFSE
jgi:hypothetical protein